MDKIANLEKPEKEGVVLVCDTARSWEDGVGIIWKTSKTA